MSSPRPSSRPSSLLPSALPHSRESSSASPQLATGPATLPMPGNSYEQRQQQHQQQQQHHLSHFQHHHQQHQQQHQHPADSASAGPVTAGSEALDSATYALPFQPFFTLVEDSSSSSSGNHHQGAVHPSVTYIFADDDQEALLSAAVRIDATPIPPALRPSSSSDTSTAASLSHRGKAPKRPPDPSSNSSSGAGGGNPRRRSGQGVPRLEEPAGAHQQHQQVERAVLITLGPDGRSVAGAVSLTPDWHVDGAELSAAPTLEGDAGDGYAAGVTGTSPGAIASRLRRGSVATPGGEEPGTPAGHLPDGPLMLKITGTGVPAAIGHEEALALGVDGLCEAFRERLADLRRVVEAAELEDGRRREGAEVGEGDDGAVAGGKA